MNDFRKAYQSTVQGMRRIRLDAADCMDERRHRKWVRKRAYRATVAAFSAVCLLFLCGFGTVRAAEYIKSVIQVKPWGFESTDMADMAMDREKEAQAYILEEQMESEADPEEAIQADTVLAALAEKENVEVEGEFIPVKHYASIEEFEKSEDIIFPQPSTGIGENLQGVWIGVNRGWAIARYEITDGRKLSLERNDYSGASGHQFVKKFPEGVCNERTCTTGQGYTYTLVDSIRASREEPLKIHAAIAVGNYEVYADFEGYTQHEAEEILEGIDLRLYE